MADFEGASKQYADDVLGQSVVSYSINGAGHLIGVRGNGSTFDAGDFTGIVTSILNSTVAAQVATQVPLAVVGTTQNRGNFSGLYDLVVQGWNNVSIINALITMRLVGNLSFDLTKMVPNPKPNTMFAIKVYQDNIGGRTISLPGFQRSMGVLNLTATPNAADILVFMYDGATWNVGLMGVDVK